MTTPSSEDKTVAEAMRFTADQVKAISEQHGGIFGKDWPQSFWTHATQLVNAALLTALAASGSKVDWAALKPSTGVNYAQGLWSRRNWEALVADQLAAAPAEQSAAMPEGQAVPVPIADARMLLAWMDETFGDPEGGDWFDADAAAVGDALNKAIENFKHMRAVAAPTAVQTKGKDDSPTAAPNSRGREDAEARFFLDHGVIHDRKTGKHLRAALGDGPIFDAEVHDTLAELNVLAAPQCAVAWGVFAMVDGAMTIQYPVALSPEGAKQHAAMFGPGETVEVRELVIAAPPPAAQSDEARELLAEAADFWAMYSSMNEGCQDDMADQRNEMLARMHAALAQKGTEHG